MRDAQEGDSVKLLNRRCAMTLMRGPMTAEELERAKRGAAQLRQGGDRITAKRTGTEAVVG